MATVLNVTEILKRSDGTEVKISGDSKFYAQNNYANLILLDIEDGGSLEACALINFTQQTRQSFTSHNFFMKPVGIVTRVVNDEVINAYQYAIQVPKLVLQNNTKGVIETDLTVTVSFGANYKGYFPNLTNLNISLPPTEQLQNDLSIAYVVELEQFLQVQYNPTTSVYEWVEVDYIDMFLTQKQYSLSSIYIQPGYSSPQGIAPISVSNTQVIMNILNDLEVLYNSLEEGLSSHINDLNNPHEVKANQVPFNNTGTQLISTTTESAIKEINANERNTNDTVNAILDGTETLREIRMGVEPNVAILRYIHTNGNNYQVVQIEYPDGRMEEINETIPVNYRNETGVTLNSGRVLMSDGTTLGGNPPRGLLFDPTSPNAYKLLGVTTLDGTQPNAKSKITKLGIVHDVLIADLFASGTTYAEGQFLWGRVGGRLSNTPPTKPALQVIVGMIINLTGNKVDILINPIIFEKLADQSDVTVTALQNKDVVRYDDVAKVWKNNNGLTVAETDIANIKSGLQVVKKAEQDQLDNVINTTYETKADATSKLATKVDKTELVPIIIELERLENEKVDLSLYTYDKGLQNTRDNAQENRLDTVEIDVANLENQNLLHSPTFNGTNGHLTFQRYGASPIVIDLPTEMIVTSGVYDDINNELVLNLASGGEVRIPVGNLLTDLDAENIRYNGAGTYYLSGKNRVEHAINELDRQIKIVNDTLPLKIDKDFTSYPELTAPEVADDDLIIVRDMSSNSVKKMRVATLRQYESDTIEYGIREIKGQTSSTFQRLKRVNGELFVGEANLVANVGVGSQVVVNSFDNIAIFNTTKVIIDGNVKVKRPLYFHKHETAIVGADVVIDDWICDKQLTNYIRPQIFIGDNGEPMDFAYLGAYQASEINGVARSVSGEFPRVDINRNNSRILARKNDGDGTNTNSRWSLKDLADYHYHITIPFWIEFATKNSQSILKGATAMPYSATNVALYTVPSTNEIIITNVQANSYRLEQTIAIGTALGGTQVANNRILKSIQLDTPNVGEATLTFDGSAVDITAGNIVYTRGWRSGMTDGIVASSGYYLENSDKVPIVFRNYENPYGNIYEFTDGGKISNHQLWVTTDRSAYNDVPSVGGNYAEPFEKVSYINALTNDYVKELGYDSLFPFARLPIVVGGNSATYYADYYYQEVGDITILSGGYWLAGVNAGLSFWLCNNTLACSSIVIGFRLSYKPF